jgi:hypothetical protein
MSELLRCTLLRRVIVVPEDMFSWGGHIRRSEAGKRCKFCNQNRRPLCLLIALLDTVCVFVCGGGGRRLARDCQLHGFNFFFVWEIELFSVTVSLSVVNSASAESRIVHSVTQQKRHSCSLNSLPGNRKYSSLFTDPKVHFIVHNDL